MFKAIGLVNRLCRLSVPQMKAMSEDNTETVFDLLGIFGRSRETFAKRMSDSAPTSVLAGVASNVGRRDISYAIARAGPVNDFMWRLMHPCDAMILPRKTASVHADNIHTS